MNRSKPARLRPGGLDDLGGIALDGPVVAFGVPGLGHHSLVQQNGMMQFPFDHPSERAVDSGPLSALFLGPTHQALVELLLVLPADSVFQMVLSPANVLVNRFIPKPCLAPVVKGLIDLVLGVHLAAFGLGVDAGHH